MVWLFLGVLLGIGGGVLTYLKMQSEKKLFLVAGTETSTVKDLEELAKEMSGGEGASYENAFSHFAEVKGKGIIEVPLKAQISGRECLYFKVTVEREREEKYWTKDSNGNRVQKRKRVWDTVSKNEQYADWYLEDTTGKIKMDARQAELDGLVETVNKYEPQVPTGGSFGQALLGIVTSMTTNDKVLGYRTKEYILPIGTQLYVLGNVSDSSGELQIQNVTEKDKKYLISTKSEEEIVASSQKSIKMQKIGSYVCFGLGGLLLVIGIISSIGGG